MQSQHELRVSGLDQDTMARELLAKAGVDPATASYELYGAALEAVQELGDSGRPAAVPNRHLAAENLAYSLVKTEHDLSKLSTPAASRPSRR